MTAMLSCTHAVTLPTLGPMIWKPSLMTVSRLVEASPFIQMSASCINAPTYMGSIRGADDKMNPYWLQCDCWSMPVRGK